MKLTEQYDIYFDKKLGDNVYRGLDIINNRDVVIKMFISNGSINPSHYC